MNFNLTLIMQAVSFTVFIWVCYRFIWPHLMGAIETRQKQIADGLAAGEAGRAFARADAYWRQQTWTPATDLPRLMRTLS